MLRTVLDIRRDITQILPVRISEGISLLRDSERTHLKTRVGEDPDKTRFGFFLFHPRRDRLSQRTNDPLLDPAVCMQCHTQRQVIERFVDPVRHVIIKCLDTCDAAVQFSIGNQLVRDSTDENPENISYSKMHPHRRSDRFFGNAAGIICRKLYAGLFPCCCIFQSFI